MYLLYREESSKLLISGKFKYFNYNSSSSCLEILNGHFLNGNDFSSNTIPGDLRILKVNDLELKYDETNGQITTRKEVIGSNIILERFDNISCYLKYSDKYFDEELKLVKKEKAVKVQSFCDYEGYEGYKLKYPHIIPSSINKNSEYGDSLLSIEGLPIAQNSQFQIILDGDGENYIHELEGEVLFSADSYKFGNEFQLVKINNKLTLYDSLNGYLGRGLNENGYDSIMYYKDIPDNLAYLEKCEDNGMYFLRCGGGESNEDDYLYIYWVLCCSGFSKFTKKRERASVLQFMMCYEFNTEEDSYTTNLVSKL
ncbi:hypothetical protein CONCODRAFT_87891 [Conidiobolus coronatus NRRL 28638]|uniref:Uncharacterized protein n=1 Tax=Conidiobolus coronatus (strain ATCC 28846 / CBS 209.66 / NRRL 28638) TaxID=796925 RepID=A0A137NRC2_CONC2|nr:hypothetical protein CONCODRAFT_87891 [Conidiobolus coronatus NRRL 28638]|eukprot:KXN65272.1 hypothetical protein CONCODRAFT_87891 [Conidiobolus coronatus NRRL 28638]